MARLEIEAENVSGSPSPFLMLGLRRKSAPRGGNSDQGLVVVEITTPDDWDVVVKLDHPLIEPGGTLRESVELEVDCAALRWHVPHEFRGRFRLRRFVFAERSLIEKSGII